MNPIYVIHYWTDGAGAAGYDEWEVPNEYFDSISGAIGYMNTNHAMFQDCVQVSIMQPDGLIPV